MDRYDHNRQPEQLRISDADRHQVAEVLRHAAGEGRIDFKELDERLEATYSAKTYADLVPITADLPVRHGTQATPPVVRPSAPPTAATRYENSIAVMSETKRQGAWLVPEQHTAFALMGSVVLDLREAQFASREVTINAVAVMAGIDIFVNAHTQVVVEGFGFMGDFSESRAKVPAELSPDSPVVRIKGMALMAGVNVRRKGMPGEQRKRLGRSR